MNLIHKTNIFYNQSVECLVSSEDRFIELATLISNKEHKVALNNLINVLPALKDRKNHSLTEQFKALNSIGALVEQELTLNDSMDKDEIKVFWTQIQPDLKIIQNTLHSFLENNEHQIPYRQAAFVKALSQCRLELTEYQSHPLYSQVQLAFLQNSLSLEDSVITMIELVATPNPENGKIETEVEIEQFKRQLNALGGLQK